MRSVLNAVSVEKKIRELALSSLSFCCCRTLFSPFSSFVSGLCNSQVDVCWSPRYLVQQAVRTIELGEKNQFFVDSVLARESASASLSA